MSTRLLSITTRIKTLITKYYILDCKGTRLLSITTRIKTCNTNTDSTINVRY